MSVLLKSLQTPNGSAQTMKIGAAPNGFFPATALNDNSVQAAASPMVAAYDALSQETFFLSEPKDDKNKWSLDWY